MNHEGIPHTVTEENLLSSSSIHTVSSDDSNNLVVNPDGSIMKATPADIYNPQNDDEMPLQNSEFRSQIIYIVDNEEIIFYADANEIYIYFDDFVQLFVKHQRRFLILLAISIAIESTCQILRYLNKEATYEDLEATYPTAYADSLKLLLNIVMYFSTAFTITFYSLGLIGALKRSSRFLRYFIIFAMLGLILEMLLAYVDLYNFLIFIVRFINLLYARILNQMLISLLLIPRILQQNEDIAVINI